MPDLSGTDHPKLKIVHVLRAPLGGLFRHVLDLARGQIARGHAVGLIADSSTGGENADRLLAELEPSLALGLRRLRMRRNPHPSDIAAMSGILRTFRDIDPDVIHGHGSKGALYARLPGLLPGYDGHAVRAYTPHGGSLNYKPGSTVASVYMRIERMLARSTDLLLFESAYIGQRYRESVCDPACMSRVIVNGISEREFEPIEPRPDAADILYVGELRAAKGIDVLIAALASASNLFDRPITAVLVGSGPDRDELGSLADRLGMRGQITFPGPMPIRQAFPLGRNLVMPSRAESLPYVALEAAAAQVPLLATAVGGIPEIFGPYRDRLIPACEYSAVRDAIVAQMKLTDDARRQQAAELAAYVRSEFRLETMVDGVIAAYRDALAAKAAARRPSRAMPALKVGQSSP